MGPKLDVYDGPKSPKTASSLSAGVDGSASEISASLSSLRASLRRQLLLHHPDKGGNAERFQEIQRQYLSLRDTLAEASQSIPADDSAATSKTREQARSAGHTGRHGQCATTETNRTEDSTEELSDKEPTSGPEGYMKSDRDLGEELLHAGDFHGAAQACMSAIRSSGEDGVLYARCSEAFLGLGEAATAIKMARRAVALQPLSAKCHLVLGASLMQSDGGPSEQSEARDVLKQALKLGPELQPMEPASSIPGERQYSEGYVSSNKDMDGHSATVRCIRFQPPRALSGKPSSSSEQRVSNAAAASASADKDADDCSRPQLLASAALDNRVKLWRCQSVTETAASAISGKSAKHNAKQQFIRMQPPSGKETHSAPGRGLMELECLATLRGHTDGVTELEWSPSGRLLCTGSLDKMAQIWSISWANASSSEGAKPSSDPASGYLKRPEAGVFDKPSLIAKSIWRLRGHEGRITCVRFVPGESHVLTASTDRTARIWNLYTGQCDSVLRGHNGIVPCLAVAPVFPPTCVDPTIPSPESLSEGGASPGLGWSEFQQPPPQTRGAETSAIAATACGDGNCRLWKITMGMPLSGPTDEDTLSGPTDEDTPSVGTRRAASAAVTTVTCLQELKGWSEGGVNLVAFAFRCMQDSGVNKLVLATSHIDFDRREGRLLFWDLARGGENWVDGKLQGPCQQFNDLRERVDDISFAEVEYGGNNGQIVAFCTADGLVKVADVGSWTSFLTLRLPASDISSNADGTDSSLNRASRNVVVSLSPCGGLLAVAFGRGCIKVWAVEGGLLLHNFKAPRQEKIYSLGWSSGSNFLASASGPNVILWSVTHQ